MLLSILSRIVIQRYIKILRFIKRDIHKYL